MLQASVLPKRRLVLAGASLLMAGLLAGCGIGSIDQSTSGTLAIQGVVHGGQQPVSGSLIRLYSAGSGGNGSAATDMLSVSGNDYVTTGANGTFSITGDYHCTHASDQVYIVATGGNPGLSPGANNAALQMMDVLGRCDSLSSSTHIFIDEVTTAAAAWALAPFMASAANVGASSTNAQGIANAFLDAQLLADPSTGMAATLPSNLTVETGKLYALANVLAACVNSDGTTTNCSQLFSLATPPYTGAAEPGTTLAAALDIVKNPANNVAALYNSPLPQPPFSSTLTAAPHDWTMSLSVTGGGLNQPTEIELDSLGNVWAADYAISTNIYIGAISGFTAQGTVLNGGDNGFGATGVLSEVYGLTVDGNNNVWATNEESAPNGTTRGSAVVFAGAASGASTGTVLFTAQDPSIDFPESMAADGLGDVLIGNLYGASGGSATIYNSSYNLIAAGLGAGDNNFGVYDLVSDTTGGVWLANHSALNISHIAANGSVAAQPACCNSAAGITRDASGNVWVSNSEFDSSSGGTPAPGSISEVAANGTVLINQERNVGGIDNPSRISVDAGQTIWVANYNGHGSTFTELAGSSNANGFAPGTAISPASGFGADAALFDTYDIVPDESGNLWTSNYGSSKLVMFFGLATPTVTPRGPVPTAP